MPCQVGLLLTVYTGTAHDCLCRSKSFSLGAGVVSITLFSHCFLRCLNTEGLMEGRTLKCRIADSKRCHIPFPWPFANWKNVETTWCSCILRSKVVERVWMVFFPHAYLVSTKLDRTCWRWVVLLQTWLITAERMWPTVAQLQKFKQIPCVRYWPRKRIKLFSALPFF